MLKYSRKTGFENNTKLNNKQEEAVLAPDGPLLIVAGAGTGKTRTLTSRLVHLIERGVPARKICALTFTNKAAGEMLERVYKFISLKVFKFDANKNLSTYRLKNLKTKGPFIGTFHSLGARILREEGQLLGRRPNFVIFDDGDSFRLVKKIVKGLLPDRSWVKGEFGPGVFYEKISQIKNGMIELKDIKNSGRSQDELILRAFAIYENRLKENNAFDFDDLIEKVVKIFRARPAALRKFQKRFTHILVDEYQDINPKQYELIQLLAATSRNLSVVGDYEQTIYGWRGSNIEIFLNFEKDWPGAQVALLEENYRSAGNIIRAAGGVIKNNSYQSIGWGTRNLWTRNPAGEIVKIIEHSDEEEEAEWIGNEIAKSKAPLDAAGRRLGADQNGRLVTDDLQFAVLYRTNAQSRAIEQALLERDIPYQIFGGAKFYERKEIKDVLAALRWALNPQDEISRERLEKNLGKRRWGKLQGVFEGLDKTNPVHMIDTFLKATDYIDYLEQNFLNPEERQENIGELVAFASEFEDLAEFIERVSLLQATDMAANHKGLRTTPQEARRVGGGPHSRNFVSLRGRQISDSPEGVSLMTIHLAKGLEFDNVIIAGFSEGLLPHHRALGNKKEIEEERRLAYVAMTRAKKKLYLSFYNLPSRFLDEVPTEFTELATGIPLDDEERFITLD